MSSTPQGYDATRIQADPLLMDRDLSDFEKQISGLNTSVKDLETRLTEANTLLNAVKTQADTLQASYIDKGSPTFDANTVIDFSESKLTNVAPPTSDNDAVTLGFVKGQTEVLSMLENKMIGNVTSVLGLAGYSLNQGMMIAPYVTLSLRYPAATTTTESLTAYNLVTLKKNYYDNLQVHQQNISSGGVSMQAKHIGTLEFRKTTDPFDRFLQSPLAEVYARLSDDGQSTVLAIRILPGVSVEAATYVSYGQLVFSFETNPLPYSGREEV